VDKGVERASKAVADSIKNDILQVQDWARSERSAVASVVENEEKAIVNIGQELANKAMVLEIRTRDTLLWSIKCLIIA
jgi:uncharacterized UPF0160 family protein